MLKKCGWQNIQLANNLQKSGALSMAPLLLKINDILKRRKA
jgi:hypothetical protein